MNRSVVRRGVSCAALLLILVFVACGGPDVKGTYSNANGLITLELRSGGEASMTMMGETKSCTYKVDKKQVQLACGTDTLDLMINDDGSLNGPGFMGMLKKASK
jgi:hypothetical protein